MKRLMAKKWFRISVRVSVGCLSLLVLAWLWFNWWAASRKRLAVAAATKAGLSLNLEDFTKDMPPSDQNFARQGIFKRLEDYYGRERGNSSPSPSSVEGLYDSMADEIFGTAFVRTRNGAPKTIDFTRLPGEGPYGQTPDSFIKEYDQRHGILLRDFQAGFPLPHVRRPFLPANFSGSASALPSLSEAFGLKLRRVSDGLVLRGEAALVTGDSAKAAESVEMILRLSEAVGSRGMLVSGLVQSTGIRAGITVLRRGIVEHRWTEDDLARIEIALRRNDFRETMKRAIASEILMMHAIESLKSKPQPGDLGDPSAIVTQIDTVKVLEWLVSKRPYWLPDAVFDLREVSLIESTLRAYVSIDTSDLGKEWWTEAENQLQENQRREGFAKWLAGFPAGAAGLSAAARTVVDMQLALAACALERHQLKHGSYPATLAEIDASVTIDPLLGVPFRYAVENGSFLLYSLGPDEKDGGGLPEPRVSYMQKNDWVW